MSAKRDKPSEPEPGRPPYPYHNSAYPPAHGPPPSKGHPAERPRSNSNTNPRYAGSYYSSFGSSATGGPPPLPPDYYASPPPPSSHSSYNYSYPPGYYSTAASYAAYDHFPKEYPQSIPPSHNPYSGAPPPGSRESLYRDQVDHPHKKAKKSSDTPVYLLRSERFNGTFTPSGTPFEGVLEGAPELGFVVDLSIFGQNYKGFILNANEYHHHLPPPKPSPKYGTSNHFYRSDVEDLEEVVKGGRRMIQESAKPSSYPYPSKPPPTRKGFDYSADDVRELAPLDHVSRSISPRERSLDRLKEGVEHEHPPKKTWICYFEHCRQSFDSSERFGEHIKKAHQNPHIDLTGPGNGIPSPRSLPPLHTSGERPPLSFYGPP